MKLLLVLAGSRRDGRLKDALLERLARIVQVAHPTNPSGNNMSQR